MYQLIGITIDFFAFNTITKINIKSNENDFNYPFITLSFEDQLGDNYCFDDIIYISGESTDLDNYVEEYDKDCNVAYLQKNLDNFNWKIQFLLNCKQNSLHNLIEWNSFTNRLDTIDLKTKGNFSSKNYGWYFSNSNHNIFYLMNDLITLGFDGENRINNFRKLLHLDNQIDYNLANIFLHSQPVPHLSEIPTLSFYFSTKNFTIIVRKVLRSYLEPPFGNCSHYYDSDRAFDASSHMQCYRRCFIYFARKHIGCHPVFVDNSISELDLEPNEEYNKTNVCLYDKY